MQLAEKDIALLRILQDDMPICERPYAELAARSGMSEDEVIERIRRWKETGVIRRIGAFIRHMRAGFSANGMVVWRVPEERVEEVGGRLALRDAGSHCYGRSSSERWPFRLYTMIHGRSVDEVEGEVKRISEEEDIPDYEILFSTRELKRASTRLFMEEPE